MSEQQCPVCNGKGVYTRILHEGAVGGFDENSFCFECGGTGKIQVNPHREQCRYCGRQHGDAWKFELDQCRDALAERVESLTADNSRLKADNQLHRDKAHNDYWCWQGDGEDHLESLVCPVLIPAHILASITRDLATAVGGLKLAEKAMGFVGESAVGQIANLQARVESLTRERDDALRASKDLPASNDRYRHVNAQLEAERDAAIKRATEAEARLPRAVQLTDMKLATAVDAAERRGKLLERGKRIVDDLAQDSVMRAWVRETEEEIRCG